MTRRKHDGEITGHPVSTRGEWGAVFANVPKRGRPLDQPGLVPRLAPFVAVAVLALVVALLPPTPAARSQLLLAALGVLVALGIAVAVVPWDAVPDWVQTSVPLVFLIFAALLREVGGGAASGFGTLTLLPVFWVALYGNTPQLVVTLIAGAAVFLTPPLLTDSSSYPDQEYVRAVIWLATTVMLALLVNRLMGALVRERGSDRALSARVSRLKESVARAVSGPVPATLEAELESVAAAVRDELRLESVSIWSKDSTGLFLFAASPKKLGTVYGERMTLGEDPERPLVVAHTLQTSHTEIIASEYYAAVPIGSAGKTVGAMELFGTAQSVSLDSMTSALDEIGGRVGDHIVRREAEAASDKQKDEFLHLVSHELKTPLTSLIGYSRLVRMGVKSAADESDLLGDLDVVDRNARLMSRLVGDLLFSASVQSDTLMIEPGPVDLNAVVCDSVQAAEPAAAVRDVTLQLTAVPVPGIVGDGDRLAQALDNLIANAIKFTDVGTAVRVGLSSTGDSIQLTVADEGPGIAPNDRPHIFQRFYRGADSSKTLTNGLGLGLAVAHAIVTAHGGEILVTQGTPRGCCFTISLPASSDAMVST